MKHRKVIAYIVLFTVFPIALFVALVAYSTETSFNFKGTSSITEDLSPLIALDAVALFVNRERTTAGLQSLTRNSKLDVTAQDKCNDMVARDYWSHDAPDGTTPWVVISKRGFAYHKAGENLAYGQQSAQQVVTEWMNSQGHKANILSQEYTDVGYAQCEYPASSKYGNNTIVVQHFADPV